MPDYELLVKAIGTLVVGAPLLLMTTLGVSSVLGRPLAERWISRSVATAVLTGLVSSLVILGVMLASGTRSVPIELGSWVAIPDYHFSVKLVFDRLSVPLVVLSFILCGTIGAFANRYLHREHGYNRFHVFYALFLLGMVVTSLAGTIETLFTGWELVGLSSALLVAFHFERAAPARNGLRVWVVYRVSDAALLIAAVVMHHLTGEGDFQKLVGTGTWPDGHAMVTENQALAVGLLLLVAAAGKSALVPFSGWLPRAMEGPTPSSAVFYGALSVHLGAFLLLRISPIIELSIWLQIAIVSIGLLTALYAAIAGRVQTDIKTALCFASLAQVGIIVAEIGFGLRYIALIHIIGHGCLRSLQFVRAPSLLLDYHTLENAIGARLTHSSSFWERLIPEHLRARFYRLALERGYLDAWLTEGLAAPLLRTFQRFDSIERRWIAFLAGPAHVAAEHPDAALGPLEELV